MEEFLGNITHCQDVLIKSYKASPPPWSSESLSRLNSAIIEKFPAAADIGSEIELIFRGHLDDLLDVTPVVTESSDPILLVKFSLEFALKYASLAPVVLPKIPFFLIEDILECQTIERAQTIWKIVEDMAESLTHPSLFARGKLVVLKTCNSLLRKLSKSCNAEFSGRVLMFLASVYPISERSAVNLPGKINAANVTHFEDEAAFAAANGISGSADAGEMEIVEIMDESQAESKQQRGENDSTASKKSRRKHKKNSQSDESDEVEAADKGATYESYKNFWDLQQFFASESKAIETMEKWRKFKAQASHVLSLFEAHSGTTAEIREAGRSARLCRQKGMESTWREQQWRLAAGAAREDIWSPREAAQDGEKVLLSEGEVGSKDTSYVGCKFLTSSQLFSLQLRDPQLRQQVAMQILYFMHYSKTKTFPFTDVAEAKEVLGDMVTLHNSSIQVIATSPPNGEADVLPALRILLTREAQWINWKSAACPPFDKPLPSQQTDGAAGTVAEEKEEGGSSAADGGAAAKRQRLDISGTAAVTDGSNTEPQQPNKLSRFFTQFTSKPPRTGGPRSGTSSGSGTLERVYQFNASLENVKDLTKALVAELPKLVEQMESYIEAEDPDNGIEDEYHPKHDDVYCWRTRRLMAQENLGAFERMYDGDIARSLPGAKALDIDAESEDEEVGEEKDEKDGDCPGEEDADEDHAIIMGDDAVVHEEAKAQTKTTDDTGKKGVDENAGCVGNNRDSTADTGGVTGDKVAVRMHVASSKEGKAKEPCEEDGEVDDD